MADLSAKVDSVKMMKNITMNVKYTRVKELAWRVAIGKWFIQMGARIMKCNIHWIDEGL